MKVYGYTDDRTLVPVDLTVDEIVSSDIDPWRLDLFDPAPIDITIGKQLLHFRRRRDFSFVHKISDTEAIVGLHDGTQTTCISGRLLSQKIDSICIDQIKLLPDRFNAHLASYLRVYAERHGKEQFAPSRHVLSDQIKNVLKEDFWIIPPTLPQAVVLNGNWLRVDLGSECTNCLRQFQFTGEMFTEVSTPVPLAPHVASVLKELEAWRPRIYDADQVRKLIAGKRIKQVKIYVDKEAIAVLEQPYRNSETVPSPRFSVAGCEFIITDERALQPDHRYLYPESDLYSVSCLHLTGRSLCAARIAYLDLSRGQTRTVRAGYYWDMFRGARTVWIEGFNLLEVPKPCVREDGENWTRAMIRANIPGTRSLCKLFDGYLYISKVAWEFCVGHGERLAFAALEHAQTLVEFLRNKFNRSA